MCVERAERAARAHGIYLLTPDVADADFASLLVKLDAALAAGVSMVQFRSKSDGRAAAASDGQRLEHARAVQAAARAHRALFIVNDDVELALTVDADGVHLGRDDGDHAAARARLPRRLLGVSCYDDLQRAEAAIAIGADLLAFGSMYASSSKPAAVRASPQLLREARRRHPRACVVAIGGIDVGNIRQIGAAGAHAAAVISAVFGAPDAGRAARQLLEEFNRGLAQHEPQRTTV